MQGGKIHNAPERIYLVVGGAAGADFNNLHDVTWSADRINEGDIEYVLPSTAKAQQPASAGPVVKDSLTVDHIPDARKMMDRDADPCLDACQEWYNDREPCPDGGPCKFDADKVDAERWLSFRKAIVENNRDFCVRFFEEMNRLIEIVGDGSPTGAQIDAVIDAARKEQK